MLAHPDYLPARDQHLAHHSGKQAGNDAARPERQSTENIGQHRRIIGTTETSQAPAYCFDWRGNGPLTLLAFRFDARPVCVAGGVQ